MAFNDVAQYLEIRNGGNSGAPAHLCSLKELDPRLDLSHLVD